MNHSFAKPPVTFFLTVIFASNLSLPAHSQVAVGRVNAWETPCGGPVICNINPLSPVYDLGDKIRRMKVKIKTTIFCDGFFSCTDGVDSISYQTTWAFYDCKKHRLKWGNRSDGLDGVWSDVWDSSTGDISIWASGRVPKSWHEKLCLLR